MANKAEELSIDEKGRYSRYHATQVNVRVQWSCGRCDHQQTQDYYELHPTWVSECEKCTIENYIKEPY